MRCEELKHWLYQEMDGEIGAAEREQVQQHLAACPACRQAREAVGKIEERIVHAAAAAPPNAARDEAALAVLREQGFVRPSDAGPDRSTGRWPARCFFLLAPMPRWAGLGLATVAAAALLWLSVRGLSPHPAPPRSLVAHTGSHDHPLAALAPSTPVLSSQRGTENGAPQQRETGPERPARPDWSRQKPAGTLKSPVRPAPSAPSSPVTEPPPPPHRVPVRLERLLANNRPHPIPDQEYLDGRDPGLLAYWDGQVAMAQSRPVALPQVPTGDDFVFVPFPQLASAAPNGGTAISEAIHRYEDEKRVVDPRLFQQVTLREKAAALDEICRNLESQTSVKLEADRVVADEKATVLVEAKPARDVMREIARLFGYQWLRSGEPGAYKYELTQDLRSQLAEEQLRNQDVQQALLDLDAQMSLYRPYLDQSVEALLARVDQLQPRWEKLRQAEQRRLWNLLESGNLKDLEGVQQYPLLNHLVKNGGWGPARLYFRLSPAERSTLLSSARLDYSMDDPNPDRRLPAKWRLPLLKSTGLSMFPTGTIIEAQAAPDKPSTPIDQVPDAEPEVTLKLDRSEAGEFSLQVGTHAEVKTDGKVTSAGGFMWKMATGRSPSTTTPDNAAANQALRTAPLFRRVIDFQPKPSCPRLAAEAERARKGETQPPDQFVMEPELREPHVNTADVWEEIHRRTGLPIVADSYMHLFPLSSFTMKQTSTFDVLCQAADRMGARWKKDGDFLLGRSTSYFWDKLKEVPNRLLRRWQQNSRANGGLPLADLLEMASLSDLQLGSKTVGEQICHCWELDEWGIIGGGPFIAGVIVPEEMRKMARTLTLLTPAQLQQAQQPEGLALTDLTPAQRQEMEGKNFGFLLYNVSAGVQPRFHLDYVPSGRYLWQPAVTEAQYKAGANRWPVVAAKTAAAALAAARRYDPNAAAGSIHRTRGRLDFTFLLPGGERHSTGGPMVLAPLE